MRRAPLHFVVSPLIGLAVLAAGAPAAGQAITPTPAGTATGIAFSPVDNTYFVVTDSPPQIVQVDAGPNVAGQTAAPANPNLAVAPYLNPLTLTASPGPGDPPSMVNFLVPVFFSPVTNPAQALTAPPGRPTGAAFDYAGNTLYVTAYTPGTTAGAPPIDTFVLVFRPGPDGVLLTLDDEIGYWSLTGLVGQPEGITFDPTFETLYIADALFPPPDGGVFEFSTKGLLLNSFPVPQPALSPGLVQRPAGIAYDPTTQTLVVLNRRANASGPTSTNLVEFTIGGASLGARGGTLSASFSGLAYHTALGGLSTVGPVTFPTAGQVITANLSLAPPGPSNGGSLSFSTAGGILSDNLSTPTFTGPAGGTGPGAVLAGLTGLTFAAATGPSPAALTVTLSRVGLTTPPAPVGSGTAIALAPVTDVYSITTGSLPMDLFVGPPLTLTLPLNPFYMPLGGGALAPGTAVGLLVHGPFVQAAVAPPAAPVGLPGPPRLRSIGFVDASGMTATFRVVSNL